MGEHFVHVITFLERFLFRREMIDQKVRGLSGGERARLLLARLLLEGANVLLLDEPTNDLDLLTLRILEEALLDFDGCALIVTHDRAFLDRVCTGMLAFEGRGKIVRYADRMQYVRALAASRRPRERATPAAPVERKRSARKGRSFGEQREFDGLPQRIEGLEAEQLSLEAVLGDPATYRDRSGEVGALNTSLEALVAEIEAAYARWEVLEAKGE